MQDSSQKGAGTSCLIFSPGDISVVFQMSSNRTKWLIVVRAALVVNCNCLLHLYTIYDIQYIQKHLLKRFRDILYL